MKRGFEYRLIIWLVLLFSFILLPSFASASGCGIAPSGTLYCQQLTFTSGNTISANTQINFTYNAGAVQGYLAANLMNIQVYNDITGNTYNAFLQGNELNYNQQSNLYTSNTLNVWIANPDGGWTTDSNLYIAYFSTSTDKFSGAGPWGASSLLSTSYCSYDDGNVVFGFYDAFCGSSLSASWTLYNKGGSPNPTVSVNHGATVTNAGTGEAGLYNTATGGYSGSNQVIESYVTINAPTGNAKNMGIGQYTGYALTTGQTNDWVWIPTSTGGATGGGTLSATATSGTYIITFENTGAAQNYLVNYASVGTTSNSDVANSNLFIYSYNTGTNTYHWYRARAYPTNGVLPSASLGSIQTVFSLSFSPSSIVSYPTGSIAVTATCLTSDSCAVDSPLGTHLCMGTSTCTYDIPDYLGAGTYTYYANDISATETQAGTLTVSQGTPLLYFTGGCMSEAWSGPCTTTGDIVSYNGQLTGNFYLNNNLLGSTNTMISNTINEIGLWSYTFNTLGNPNYTAGSNTYVFEFYEIAFAANVLATGAVHTTQVGFSNSPFHWNTYFPIDIYTQSPSNTLSYSLYGGRNSCSIILQANVLNVSYQPPSNQATGNYIYCIDEFQQGNSQVTNVIIAANTLNMMDFNGMLTFNSLCSTIIQYYPNCAIFPFAANVFTAPPKSWYIVSNPLINEYMNGTGGSYNLEQFSQPTTTFNVFITLIYPSPFTAFTVNVMNNPLLQNTLTQTPYQWTLTSSPIVSERVLGNFSVFSQETFNAIPTNLTLKINATFNTYPLNTIISNTMASDYYLEILKSTYLNPNITYNLNDSASTPLFYFHPDTYCPITLPATSNALYPIGLVDTNGSKYNFYVYTSAGGTASGYIMQVIEGKGVGTIQVQSYLIPATIPFSLALEATGQQYAFDVFSGNCKNVYFRGTLSVPTNPIYITLNQSNNAYVYNTTKALGKCYIKNTTIIGSNTFYGISCYAADATNVAYKYTLNFYNVTSLVGTTSLLFNRTFTGSSFIYNFTEPDDNSIYTAAIIGYLYQANDPAQSVWIGQLNFPPINLASPLLGLVAALIMLALILGGASTGKVSIMMLLTDVGLIIVGLFIDIPTGVGAVFIVISILSIWWSKWG